MKKKYVLSTLVSLALGSGYALAEGDSAPSETPVWTPPTVEQPFPEFTRPVPPEPPVPVIPEPPATQQPDSAKSYQEMMEKRRVLWQEMQVLRGKISQTWDPEERQRLIEELRQKMPQRGGMPGGPYGIGPQGGFGGPMGGPPHPQGPRYDMPGGPYYGMGPQGGGFGGPMGGPSQGPRDDMQPRFNGPRSFCPKGKKDCGHHTKMLERLENIENLLKQIVDLLKDKKD
jgi:hypothetical protein